MENKDNQYNKYIDIQNDYIYSMLSTITNFMDKRFLDPVLGFVFPAFGDTLMSVMVLPYLYFSIFRIKSLPLTLAIILNTLMDILVGIIPYGIGDIFDIFHRSYVKNFKLIDGFIHNDKKVIREVNRKAWITGILIVLLCVAIFFLLKVAISIAVSGFSYIMGLFS